MVGIEEEIDLEIIIKKMDLEYNLVARDGVSHFSKAITELRNSLDVKEFLTGYFSLRSEE